MITNGCRYSSGLLLAAQDETGSPAQVWIVNRTDGTPRRISSDLNEYLSVSISADGKKIASAQQNQSTQVWTGPASTPDRLSQITNSRKDIRVAFTPDDRIVYLSNTPNGWDLFVTDTTGARCCGKSDQQTLSHCLREGHQYLLQLRSGWHGAHLADRFAEWRFPASNQRIR